MPESELTLALETSNPGASPEGGGSVALGMVRPTGSVELLGEKMLRPTGRHDDALMPAIDDLVRSSGFAPNDLSRIAVSLGPGGYTSVRIGTMTAKTLGFALNAACVGVPTAAVAATAAGDADARVLVTLASKRGSCWAAAVSTNDVREIDEWGVVDAEEFSRRLGENAIHAALADAHLPDAIRAVCDAHHVRIDAIHLTANACLRASVHFGAVAPIALEPIYPREPEAVRIWRDRLAGRG